MIKVEHNWGPPKERLMRGQKVYALECEDCGLICYDRTTKHKNGRETIETVYERNTVSHEGTPPKCNPQLKPLPQNVKGRW